MLRGLISALLCLPAASGAVWPDQFANAQRTATRTIDLKDRAVWDEYGLDLVEQAEYKGTVNFTATLYRLKDSTGSLAAFFWQRPNGATASKTGDHAVEWPEGALVAVGNYLFRFDGYRPASEQIRELTEELPRMDQSPLPPLVGYLPDSDRVPNSERYIVGPASLAKFEPSIQPSVAAFHLGVEGQTGRFHTKGGEFNLAIFSYPTPDLARQLKPEFEKIPGAMVKRTGPLLAVAFSPGDANAAERLLARIEYKPSISFPEHVPTRRDNIGDLVINAFILIGMVLAFATAVGLAFGALRVARRRRFGNEGADDPMIVLDLRER